MKIKVKNISTTTRERICYRMDRCSECPFYSEEGFVTDEGTNTACMFYGQYDLEETVVELSEKDFPTNREWLASLSNDKLANNLVTNPIFAESGGTIEKWLSQPCKSLMEEE